MITTKRLPGGIRQTHDPTDDLYICTCMLLHDKRTQQAYSYSRHHEAQKCMHVGIGGSHTDGVTGANFRCCSQVCCTAQLAENFSLQTSQSRPGWHASLADQESVELATQMQMQMQMQMRYQAVFVA